MPAAKKASKKTKTDARKNRPRVAGSIADQIDKLEVNQCYSESVRFEIDGVDQGGINEELKRLRSGLAAYVARITDDLDTREFRVESGTFITNDHAAVIVNCTVTRVE